MNKKPPLTSQCRGQAGANSSLLVWATKKLILLAIFCLCPLLQGCVGFVVAKQQTEVVNNPVISTEPGVDRPTEKPDPNTPKNRLVYSSAWLQTHWGNPKHIRHTHPGAGADEVWTYHFGPIWEGVMPCLIVPIPLVLPVGEKKVCFTVRDGHVVSVSVTRAATGGVFWPKKL